MRLVVVGVPCTGKTTLTRHLREVHELPALDMDDEILRANGGVWPDIPTKNTVVAPKVLAEVVAMGSAILFHPTMTSERAALLRDAGFRFALLDVSPAELRRRDAERLAAEGWTNSEWFEHNQAELERMRADEVFDVVIDAERSIEQVAAAIVRAAS